MNTVIVAQAHKLGLASLYQLRGRVGRSATQAYAHFFHPKTTTGVKEEEERRMRYVFD